MTRPTPTATEIFQSLPGNWTLVRDLGPTGQFKGDVTFNLTESQKPGFLRYREEGILERGDGKRFDGYREYDFVLREDPPAIELLFRDPVSFGNRYVLLQFGEDATEGLCARDIHPCGEDFYHHCMIWHDADHFETKIKITGPKKNHLLHSIYRHKISETRPTRYLPLASRWPDQKHPSPNPHIQPSRKT